MDRSIEDPFGVGESSVESADRGRGLDTEEEEEEEQEAAGLGGAILEIVCYCCSAESQEVFVFERSQGGLQRSK